MNAPFIDSRSTVHELGGAASQFERVSDAELLESTRRLVGQSNELLAALLAHLAEVEARGIHRLRACSSLYMYCVYELRLSEDAAFRRARAARVARKFPVIFQQVADGELHLTAIVLLAPHLTEDNHRELLALAKHRTKREVLRLVRTLAPEPTVPDRIEPLGPESIGIPVPAAATWRKLVESLATGVRELPPGDRPKDWVDRAGAERAGNPPAGSDVTTMSGRGGEAERQRERYKVQFTVWQEYVDLLERAQDLLSHAVPTRSLEEVHLRALRVLVEQLDKRKYGAPRRKPSDEPVRSAAAADNPVHPSAEHGQQRQSKKHTHAPRRSGTAAARREVRDRDGLQCTFVDEFGRRCRETRFLEIHHEVAHALGGDLGAKNLAMRCQAHNALAAERDFGREFMRERVGKARACRTSERSPP